MVWLSHCESYGVHRSKSHCYAVTVTGCIAAVKCYAITVTGTMVAGPKLLPLAAVTSASEKCTLYIG